MKLKMIAAALLATSVSACDAYAAGHATAPAHTIQVGDQVILGDANNMSLYIFDNDSAGISTCYGGCAQKWPPLFASADDKATGDMSIIKRDDGTLQWAHKGQALYYWVSDQRPGHTRGDGVGGVWHLARP